MARKTRKPPPKDWRAIIVDRIEGEGYSVCELEAETGVSRIIMWRFFRRRRGITLASAEKLCAALDLVLVPREMVSDEPA
jgi:hypothetical protein